MSQEINLRDILGRDPSQLELASFGEQAINRIIERTQDGKTLDGKNFAAYSPEYAELKGSNDVDLTLAGDMLLSVDSRFSGSSVELFIDDELNTKKGYNHHVGDTLPKRPWFGLTDKEAREIANDIKQNQAESIIDIASAASIFQAQREPDITSILQNIGLFVD